MLTKTIFLCTLSHYIVRHEVLFQWRWLWVLGHSATFHVGSESRIYGSNNERSGQVILRIIAQVARKRFGCNDDCWRQFRFRPRVVGIAWLQSGGLRQYLPEYQSPFSFCECLLVFKTFFQGHIVVPDNMALFFSEKNYIFRVTFNIGNHRITIN